MQVEQDHEGIFRNFLSEIDVAAVNPNSITDLWSAVCETIKHDALTRDRFEFLRWPSLGNFSAPEAWIPVAWYDLLFSDPQWHARWRPLTRDTKVGHPKDYSKDHGTSPILVQHAYHLFRYEALTGHSLIDCDVIFEVGGGYGSFCRLLKNAGFNGTHIIYDLPHVSAIQRLYLGLSGYTETSLDGISGTGQHAVCLISGGAVNTAYEILSDRAYKVGLVATWSLSEFPLAARQQILPRFLNICSKSLLAYQPGFEGVNNVEYFDSIVRQNPTVIWRTEEVPPSRYLFS